MKLLKKSDPDGPTWDDLAVGAGITFSNYHDVLLIHDDPAMWYSLREDRLIVGDGPLVREPRLLACDGWSLLDWGAKS